MTTFQPGQRVAVLHQRTREIETHGTIVGGIAPSREHAIIQYDDFADLGATHMVRRSDLVAI